jgi:imidazolonepropionase-like amidohydrolase
LAALETAAFPVAMTNLKKIYDAGILVALGTDSGATPVCVQGFAEHVELALMVQAGLTPLQAISIATKNAAQLLSITDNYGTLEPGNRRTSLCWRRIPHRAFAIRRRSGLSGKMA